MIKAQELRIGNWINDVEAQPSIRQFNFKDYDPSVDELFEGFEPIPLTPEILLENCGFVKVPQGYRLPNTEIELSKNNFYPMLKEGEYFYGVALDYLHQLQNFCFALTGKELEVNLHAATTH